VNAVSGDIELTKLLTLKQYLHIYGEIKRHVSDAAAEPHCTTDTPKPNVLDASVIMMQYVVMHSLYDCIHLSIYSVSQKKVAPLKFFAIFSLMVNLCN